jgi:hypothetical protein
MIVADFDAEQMSIETYELMLMLMMMLMLMLMLMLILKL